MEKFMKSTVLRVANSLLKPFGARIVKDISDDFQMPSAVRRIIEHRIKFKSIIDIGASDGKWSLSMMGFFPSASFIAIEPLQERETALEYLKRKYANFDYELCVAGES